MRRSPLLLFALISFVVSVSPAHARVWKVRQDGTGDFTTIQAAIHVAFTGDSVHVWPGTYLENITFEYKGLVVLAVDGPAVTTIDGFAKTRGPDNGSTVYMYTGAPATLRGFKIVRGTGTDPYYTMGGGVRIDTPGQVVDCWITLNGAFYGGGISSWSSAAVVRSCRIYVNSANYFGGGVWGFMRVEDSVIYENTNANPTGGAGVYMNAGATLQNCTVVKNYGVGVCTLWAYGSTSIEHSVIAYSTFKELLCDVQPDLKCDVIFNPKDATYCGNDLGGNVYTDPLLCDIPGHDYSPTAASPCLPASNTCGALIGALPQGCGVVSVEPESWGSIKAHYSNR